MKHFKNITESGDFSACVYERKFSGRLTPNRWSIITKYCAQNSWRERCGCEFDCCGHKYEQSMEIAETKLNAQTLQRDFIIRLYEFFNV